MPFFPDDNYYFGDTPEQDKLNRQRGLGYIEQGRNSTARSAGGALADILSSLSGNMWIDQARRSELGGQQRSMDTLTSALASSNPQQALVAGMKGNPYAWSTLGPVVAGALKSQMDPTAAAHTYALWAQGRKAQAEAANLSPSSTAAKLVLQQKLETGAMPTREEILAAFPQEPTPPMPGLPTQPSQPAAPIASSAQSGLEPFQRNSSAPLGSENNPVYTPSNAALAQLPAEVWYTTPASSTPQQKSRSGQPTAAAPGIVVDQSQSSPYSIEGSQPLAPGTRLPPGATPTGLQARPGSPLAGMQALSENAQRAENAMRSPFLDRAGQMAAKERLESDPTYQARHAQATEMGKDNALVAKRQGEGANVMAFADKIVQNAKLWQQYAPSALNAAIGPFNSRPSVQAFTGFANPGGYALWNSLNHDVNALTALYNNIPGPKGPTTDAANATFNAAVGEWREARDPDTMFAIMERMRDLIRAKANLPPDYTSPPQPIDAHQVKMLERYRESGQSINPTETAKFHPGYVEPPPAAPTVGPQVQKANTGRSPPVKVQTPEEAAQLPPGTEFVTPDGRIKVRP